jgi:hypothetical protein
MKTKIIASLITLITFSQLGFAQQKSALNKNEFALLFGLNQPLLADGFNFELNYFTPKLAFDYSHGFSLEIKGAGVVGAMKEQQLVAHIPYSVGVGVGYRLTKFLNLRAEPKWHRFEIYYDREAQLSSNQVTAYNTFTLGLGLYGKWHPFEKKGSGWRNLMIAPSVRWWPNVATSLPHDKISYFNKMTNKTEVHEALNIGFANTPLILNISVGYRF